MPDLNTDRRDDDRNQGKQMSEATKLPALDGRANPCLHCPSIGARLEMDHLIAVGFGDAHVERDGEEIYREPSAYAGMVNCPECKGTGGPSADVLCGGCAGSGMVEDPNAPDPEYWDVAEAEKAAAADPDHDWRIVLYGPLHGEVYQRHEPGVWNLVEKNQGFA